MKKQSSLLIITLLFVSLAQAQLKYDNTWTIGYGDTILGQSGYQFGGIVIDFNHDPMIMKLQPYVLDRPKAAISTYNGDIVAYTDGCRISNKNHLLMANGDTLNPGTTFDEFCSKFSYPLPQPTLFLPGPDQDSVFYLLHVRSDDISGKAYELLYSTINSRNDNGSGKVMVKNQLVIRDSLFLDGFVNATRHANGRDFWIVVPRSQNKGFHVVLLTPNGLYYQGCQTFELPIDNSNSVGQTAFAFNGNQYFKSSYQGIVMLNFDRCSGFFYDPKYLELDSIPNGGAGIATSRNNTYMYTTSGYSTFQYNLKVPDITSGVVKIAEWDGFTAPFPTSFYHIMPTPDGRLFISTTFSNTILHVINNPNREAPFCRIKPRGIILPAISHAFLPNFINYNLGPIDGSACDTLGIDNLPIAAFHWDIEDSLSLLDVTFTDYSYHEPTAWHWTFGDGQTSSETNPVHAYTQAGTYEVCLVVSNEFSADTFCRQVQVGTTGVHTLPALPHARVSPNPFGSTLSVELPALVGVSPEFVLYDLYGRVVKTARLTDFDNHIPASELPAGLYVWQLRWNGEVTQVGKVVKE